MVNDLVKISKLISLILRHKSKVVNLSLDDNVDELIAGINQQGHYINKDI